MNRRIVYNGFFKVEIIETPQGEREVVRATDSVTILFYNLSNQSVLLIREPRAPMITNKNPDGSTIGNVAGRFDIDISPRALVVKEAKEEAGIIIEESDVILLNHGQSLAVNSGMTNEKCYLAFAVISDAMFEQPERIFGNQEEGERIERIWLTKEQFKEYQPECLRVFTLQQWFLNQETFQ
ncbi:MAG: NUDIX domain-containing protein [Candidatus Buchananbacteria bacterium]|nr:NUDIX domain-containing protein [Candidatus Buchananbacteria bacterium]